MAMDISRAESANTADDSDESQELEVLLTPLRQAAPRDGGFVDVLVQLKAPPCTAPIESGASCFKRPPLCLALVLDCTDNMAGQSLEDALICMRHIISRLDRTDQVAVVFVNRKVEVLVPLQAGYAGTITIAAVTTYVGEGSPGVLADGLEEGARQLAAAPSGATSRMFLFSDGMANCDVTYIEAVSEQCARLRAKGVTTSTVGLGKDACLDLLQTMAKAGGGLSYHGYGLSDLCAGFDQELGLIDASYLSDIRLIVQLFDSVIGIDPPGTQPSRHKQHWYELPNLRFGAEVSFLMRLLVGPDKNQSRCLLSLRLRGIQEIGQSMLDMRGFCLTLDNLDEDEISALPCNSVVRSRLLESGFDKVAIAARKLLRSGDQIDAQEFLNHLEPMDVEHAWVSRNMGS